MEAFRSSLWTLGRAARKKNSFMKRLGVFHWRISKNQKNKNPHALKLEHIQTMKKQNQQDRINELKLNSPKPFGRFTHHGRFILHREKIPFYNIPDLSGFNLKPYVAENTPKVLRKEIVKKKSEKPSQIGFMRRITDPLSSLKK